MTVWRYYNIGKGIKVRYVGVQFNPSITILEPFTACQAVPNPARSIQKLAKVRLDRKANLLFFCQEAMCSKVCESREELEQHMLSEEHELLKGRSSSDAVKINFMKRINSSIHEARTIFHPVQSSTPSCSSTSLVLPSNINI